MAAKQKRQNKNEDIKSPMSLGDVLAMKTPEEAEKDKLVDIAWEQLNTSVKYKEQRMAEVQKSLDLYSGKTKKALKGRWNVPLPIMSGYIDTIISRTDEPPVIKYGYQDVADMRRAAKVQAKWDQDAIDPILMWNLKKRQEKFVASFYGYGISKRFAYNDEDGMCVSVYDVVDPMDFECEPMGGQLITEHKFKGQRNIFKTKSDLEKGATGDDPIYDKRQVLRLVSATGSKEHKEFKLAWQEKTDRLKALGFNQDQHSYVGIKIYNLVEWYMEHPETGEKWYILFDPHSKIWVRCQPLEEVLESGEDPYTVWHTHLDPFNFYSKAPADDMRPVAEAMTVIFNQALDNREKKNYAQRAYDPAVFDDPAQLEWRQDGLVASASGASAVQPLGNGIYNFTVQDMPEQGTINLMTFMDSFTGLKTGANPNVPGEAEDKRVAVYFGELQQAADRLGLYNKAYSEAQAREARLYYFGLRQCIKSNRIMVKMIGSRGYDWVELVKEDTNPNKNFNITVESGQAKAQLDALSKKEKKEGLALLLSNPAYTARMNPDVVIEETLRSSGWEEAQIRRFMDMQSYGSEEEISYAEQAVQDIVYNNVRPKPYRKATTVFVQYIIDRADALYDHEDVDISEYQKLMDYANAHMEFVIYNSVSKNRMAIAGMGQGALPPGEQTTPTLNAEEVVPGSPGGESPVSEVPVTPGGAKEVAQIV